jgi:ribosomal protein L37AE/L43A
MAYSKEAERQNKALGDVLAGRTPEKRVMVGYEGKKQKSGDQISRMTNLMKEARMPMFCPECDKIMKKKLDDKMWRMFGHCFDCQVTIENKLRIEGKYEEWAENKIRKNKIAFIKDQIQAISEWKDMKAPEFYNNVGVNYPMLEKEKWDVDMDKVQREADEAIQKYTEVLEELENE